MDRLSKEDILKKIITTTAKSNNGRNSMGVSENYYDPFFLLGKCYKDRIEDFHGMSEDTLNELVRVAQFAADVFY